MSRKFDFDSELERLILEDRSRHSWALVDIARSFRELVVEVRKIGRELTPKIVSLEIEIMPKTIVVGGTSTAVITGTGSDGNPWTFSSADNLAPVASAPSDVSFGAVSFNADGSASIIVTGNAVDSGDQITVSSAGVTSNADVLTINAVAPTLASINLSLT